MEALADMKIYRANNYIISGHSLEHLCSAIAPVLVTVMLMQRSSRIQRHISANEQLDDTSSPMLCALP
ncbi:hypothetical protein REPUB_Repub03eG0039700 [Reevesia pubescens]